jgi:hypothetical protein
VLPTFSVDEMTFRPSCTVFIKNYAVVFVSDVPIFGCQGCLFKALMIGADGTKADAYSGFIFVK